MLRRDFSLWSFWFRVQMLFHRATAINSLTGAALPALFFEVFVCFSSFICRNIALSVFHCRINIQEFDSLSAFMCMNLSFSSVITLFAEVPPLSSNSFSSPKHWSSFFLSQNATGWAAKLFSFLDMSTDLFVSLCLFVTLRRKPKQVTCAV